MTPSGCVYLVNLLAMMGRRDNDEEIELIADV